MIQEGGISPLLGRFKGDCKGGESKLPLCHSFFQPSTALSFSCEKESGVEKPRLRRSSLCACGTDKGVTLRVMKVPRPPDAKSLRASSGCVFCAREGAKEVSPLRGDKNVPLSGDEIRFSFAPSRSTSPARQAAADSAAARAYKTALARHSRAPRAYRAEACAAVGDSAR